MWAGDTLVAYVERMLVGGVATGTPQTYYVHPDHLGSTNLITNASGTVVQTLDYYPFGATRINNQTGGADTKKKFVGIERDDQTGLDYAKARYYDNSRGQFTSQDPVFWEIGDKIRGSALTEILKNPQALNSYSWAENNPIIKKDPEGRCAGPLIFVCLGVIGANLGIWTNYAGGVLEKQAQGSANPYEFTMGYNELGTSAVLGGFELAALPAKRVVGGIYAAGSSLAEDRAAGNAFNYGKAAVSGGTAFVTGSLFSGLIGKVPAALAPRAQIGNQVFQNASILVANNAAGTNVSVPFQTAQSAAKAVGIGNTGSGTFIGTYNFGPGVGTFNFGTGSWVGTAQSTPSTLK